MRTRPIISKEVYFLFRLQRFWNSDEIEGLICGEWGIRDKAYHLVAILGAQSSGKSTLLNALFGTHFPVMQESVARSQTTHGIWLSKAHRSPDCPIIVMDVEGTDGRERAEDQDFERKSALFSLAIAEILIINLWEHTVGLYHGANMSLLKTILDVHLQLVAKEKSISRTTLLFVVRDYIGVTPVESLRATVMGDLERIWAGLRKPEALEAIEMEAVLGFAFAFLPHKILKPSQFDEAVSLLGERFSGGEDSLFPSETSDKIVPADGLSFYMRSIWEKIVDNKDLDLPNQQELLAQYRCDELATEAFLAMTTAAEPLLAKKAQFDAGFGAACNALKQDCLGAFSGAAYRYATEVFQRKLLELAQRIDAFLYPAFTAQLQCLKASQISSFDKTIKGLLSDKDGVKASAFATAIAEANAALLMEFEAKATSAILNGSNWSVSDFSRELADELELLSNKAKEQRCHQELDRATAKASTRLIEACTAEKLSCEEPAALIQSVVEEILGDAKEAFEELHKADLLTSNQQTEQLLSFTNSLKAMLKGQVLAEASIKAVTRQIFEEAFRYDEAGRPRVWSAADNLDAAFDAAKDKAMAALDQLTKVEIASESLEILDEKRQDALIASLSRHFETVFLDAKRSTLTQATSIPPWIYLLILFLGWNEFMAVLHNPLYLVLAILALSAWFLTGALGVRGMLEAQVRAQLTQVYNAVFTDSTAASSPKLKAKAN